MRQEDRKAAIAAYRERKAASGIYLLRCRASGESWAGHAPDLATIRNRLWFTLRQQSHRHHELQAAWARHGEGMFDFEVVEALDEKALESGRERVLKARLAHWCGQLGARTL